MLEGNEVEKSYDNGAGKLAIDVTDKGSVKFSNSYEKDLDGYAKVKNVTEIESDIFMIARKIVAKTKTTWDDSAEAALEKLLGIEPGAAAASAAAKID